MKVEQGSVYWVDLGEPLGSAPGYRRPCVVIQNDSYNRTRINTTIVCVITGNLRLCRAPGNVLLAAGEGGLPRDSVVNVSQVITVDKRQLGEQIGALASHRLDHILLGVWGVLERREPVEDERGDA